MSGCRVCVSWDTRTSDEDRIKVEQMRRLQRWLDLTLSQRAQVKETYRGKQRYRLPEDVWQRQDE